MDEKGGLLGSDPNRLLTSGGRDPDRARGWCFEPFLSKGVEGHSEQGDVVSTLVSPKVAQRLNLLFSLKLREF